MKAIAPRDIGAAPPSVRESLKCSMRLWSEKKMRDVLALWDDRLQRPFRDPVVSSNISILRSLLAEVIEQTRGRA